MDDRRRGERHLISFPIRVEWKGPKGEKFSEDGLTENVGPSGALVHLPRVLPEVGSTVRLTVCENPKKEITVQMTVLRLERNAAHPQCALMMNEESKSWMKNVVELAQKLIAEQKPEEFDDWN
jgi:hypothetical protein